MLGCALGTWTLLAAYGLFWPLEVIATSIACDLPAELNE